MRQSPIKLKPLYIFLEFNLNLLGLFLKFIVNKKIIILSLN